MKKTIMMMLGLALAMTACKDGGEVPANSGPVDLTIRVGSSEMMRSLPNTGGMTAVTGHKVRYVLEVLDAASKTSIERKANVENLGTATSSFSLSLNPGSYDFLFWADFVTSDDTDLYYDTQDLTDVQILKSGANYLGDHTRDAYCGARLAQAVNSSYTFSALTLTRPFGRIEVAATDFDPAVTAKVPAKAKLTYTSAIPSSYNVSTGTVGSATLASQNFTITLDPPATGGVQTLDLLYDYVLAASAGTSVNFKVELLDGSDAVLSTRNMAGITAQANKRTTLAGDFYSVVTKDFDGSVTISENFSESVNPDTDYMPTSLTASAVTATGMTLTWSAVKDATEYRVEYATNSGFTTGLTVKTGITAKTYALSSLTAGTTYYIRVVAVSAATGFSVVSATATQATAAE